MIAGTADEVADALGAEVERGVEGFVLQFSDFGTPETIQRFMTEVAPAVRAEEITMDTPMAAETVTITGHDGDEIEAYFARPTSPGPHPGRGRHPPHARLRPLDEGDRAHVRGLRLRRALPEPVPPVRARRARSTDAAAAATDAGGVPDEQCIGDVRGAADFLRALPQSNGRVGVIGYCSGGRQAYVVACSLDFDAAVDCYGGRVVAAPEDLTPAAVRSRRSTSRPA